MVTCTSSRQMFWITLLWRCEIISNTSIRGIRPISPTVAACCCGAAKLTGGHVDVLIQSAARMERENGLNGFLD